MPITFTCPHCGLITEVEKRYLGRSGPCAGCGKKVEIPTGRQSPTDEAIPPSFVDFLMKAAIALGVVTTLVVVTFIVLWIAAPAISRSREIRQSETCASQMERIIQAMDAYHTDHGSYPPVYSVGPDGKPCLSWRVLLLPYLGSNAQAIYSQINLDEPWNSPTNSWITGQIPDVYKCPTDPDEDLPTTSYMLAVGKGMLFEYGKTSTRDELRQGDGASQTIMLVEVAESEVNWAEPVDIDAAKLAQGINSGLTGSICSEHGAGGAHAAFADGSVHFLPSHTLPAELQAMLSVDGGEIVEMPR